MKIYKFTETDKEKPTYTKSDILAMYDHSAFSFGVDSLIKNGTYREAGWCFDVRDDVHTYWVQYKDGSIQEYHSPNKTKLRKLLPSSRVRKIADLLR